MFHYRVLCLAVIAALVCFAGSAQAANILVNGDCIRADDVWTFEGYGGGVGWDDHGGDGRPHCIYFYNGTQDKAMNMTTHPIAAGEVYTLSTDASVLWDSHAGIIEARIVYEDTLGAWQELAATSLALPGANPYNWQSYPDILSFTAEAGEDYIGRPVGVRFGRIYGSIYAGIDMVELDCVPEPTTLALLATGLLGLAGYAWRKLG